MIFRTNFCILLVLLAISSNGCSARYFPTSEMVDTWLERLQFSPAKSITNKTRRPFADSTNDSPIFVTLNEPMKKNMSLPISSLTKKHSLDDPFPIKLDKLKKKEKKGNPSKKKDFFSACRLPSDPFGIVETYLAGPAMMYHRHGTVPPGSIVKMTCKIGFTMASVDPHEALCLRDGTWSRNVGRCRPIACILSNWLLGGPDSTSVLFDRDQSSAAVPGTKRLFKVGSHVHFICASTGESVFPSDVYCMPNGHWSFRPPKKCFRSYYNWDAYRSKANSEKRSLRFF